MIFIVPKMEGMANQVQTNVQENQKKEKEKQQQQQQQELVNPLAKNYGDNYNHFDQTSTPGLFHGSDGGTASIVKTLTDNYIVVTKRNGTTETYNMDVDRTYRSVNGGHAIVKEGNKVIELTLPDGSQIRYDSEQANVHRGFDDTINQYVKDSIQHLSDISNVNNQFSTTSFDNHAYLSSLPKGIPRSQIPDGEEDLYILKSQVVPPVCPRCPDPVIVHNPYDNNNRNNNQNNQNNNCSNNFNPDYSTGTTLAGMGIGSRYNYSALDDSVKPMPMLADFSGFGS